MSEELYHVRYQTKGGGRIGGVSNIASRARASAIAREKSKGDNEAWVDYNGHALESWRDGKKIK